MSNMIALPRPNCSLLAVLCGEFAGRRKEEGRNRASYPFPELVSSGRLEVQTLVNPTLDRFQEIRRSLEPNVLFFQGEKGEKDEETGSLVWGTVDVSDPELFCSLFSPPFPTIVYLEVPNSENIAQALHFKGVPYVIYWKNAFSSYAASHFRHSLFSVIQSSCSHACDAFQLAHASFRFYCVRNGVVLPDGCQKSTDKLGPHLIGDAPKINIEPLDKGPDDDAEDSSDSFPTIKIYDEDVEMKFLVCGYPCRLDSCFLASLEDGLSALLNIEIRGSKLQNRVSATPPPLQAASVSRGVVTMRCDITTCSSAHISLLVSGSAQTCFDDQLLESHIKNELIEKTQLVHALPTGEQSRPPFSDPSSYASIAAGASVFEITLKVPSWGSQVLKQLAPDFSYRSLVALGIASTHGTAVASFDKEDADRLLFFCSKQANDVHALDKVLNPLPNWASLSSKKRPRLGLETKPITHSNIGGEKELICPKVDPDYGNELKLTKVNMRPLPVRQRTKVIAMRPVPYSRQHKMRPFWGISEADAYDGSLLKSNLPSAPIPKQNLVPAAPSTHRKSMSNSLHAQQIVSLNPLPMKKHGCSRSPIQVCSEEEFLRDVMQFLILRGHSRLVPQGGISEFPDAILNAKRLDLYNLYREVVSRGGFHVGNGINWKGQVFSKMRNHTMTNRMTGVGNTLKRHYETYLLEYELAHDDVDGECCLLCHSSAPGDWVNCGLCGEWAHFGCDRRQGLGTFKDYAKTDGLEYICPHCSVNNFKRKSPKMANGFSHHTSTVSRPT
ncbi:Zinc finger RING/FYVE/PHD-type protein [Dioscorea alata]|uniref:Zinc finger RING/FYVE/PHD-type protein n=1 Tax=Dioscorea alata TaxID=55571 RepID=A0ACB7VZ13_DIOAL|nr:Zinc finger RING/FYVE/PHD-type protein [Dioscorea alata]